MRCAIDVPELSCAEQRNRGEPVVARGDDPRHARYRTKPNAYSRADVANACLVLPQNLDESLESAAPDDVNAHVHYGTHH